MGYNYQGNERYVAMPTPTKATATSGNLCD